MQYLVMASVVGGMALLIWLGIHFGSRWIDKMLCFERPDPSKPIVRKAPPCAGCDGYECDERCAYPGAVDR